MCNEKPRQGFKLAGVLLRLVGRRSAGESRGLICFSHSASVETSEDFDQEYLADPNFNTKARAWGRLVCADIYRAFRTRSSGGGFDHRIVGDYFHRSGLVGLLSDDAFFDQCLYVLDGCNAGDTHECREFAKRWRISFDVSVVSDRQNDVHLPGSQVHGSLQKWRGRPEYMAGRLAFDWARDWGKPGLSTGKLPRENAVSNDRETFTHHNSDIFGPCHLTFNQAHFHVF